MVYWPMRKPFETEESKEIESRRVIRDQRHALPNSSDIRFAVQVDCLADIDSDEVQWLWRDVIPLGKVTTLTGEAGVGKTFLAVDIAADVTCGRRGGENIDDDEPGSVLIISPDNDLADVISPRLKHAGADLERVSALRGVSRRDPEPGDLTRWLFRLNIDLRLLELEIGRQKSADVPLRLIIIDPFPLQQFANRKDAAELSGVLNHLAEIATWSQTAVLLVVNAPPHLQKSEAVRNLEAAVHSTWTVVSDFENPKRRMLLPVKTNLTENQSGRAFRIQNGELDWETDSIQLTAEQFRVEAHERARTPLIDLEWSELARARDWLRERLGSETVPFKTIKAEALANDISDRTLHRAFCGLRGVARRINDSRAWEWSLQPVAAESSGAGEQ